MKHMPPIDQATPDQATPDELHYWEQQLSEHYKSYRQLNLQLDLTRGKPSPEQLDLSSALDGILQGNFNDNQGTDIRNYGGLDGLPAAKSLFAELLDIRPDEILIGGNSSLTMMYTAAQFYLHYDMAGNGSAWSKSGNRIKFLAPVPGYDRHFGICDLLGIELIPVTLNDDGPNMDQVETLVANDPSIKGIWCVPRFSNPTGIIYSEAVVARLAQLATIAGPHFRIFWDHAYVVHTLNDSAPEVANIMNYCRQAGTEDSVLLFASTSKITFPGAGVACMGCSTNNMTHYKKRLALTTIGPDKINQQRHVLLLNNRQGILEHMRRHAAIIKPRFDAVIDRLDNALSEQSMGYWTRPQGGYFITFNTLPGLAKQVVAMANDVGVKLTPAGAPFPGGHDPEDSTIRLAPSFPSLQDIEQAIDVFIVCVKLTSVRQRLVNHLEPVA